jgi:hypothetical protein
MRWWRNSVCAVYNNDLIVIYSSRDVLFTEGSRLRGSGSESDITDLHGGMILCKERHGMLAWWSRLCVLLLWWRKRNAIVLKCLVLFEWSTLYACGFTPLGLRVQKGGAFKCSHCVVLRYSYVQAITCVGGRPGTGDLRAHPLQDKYVRVREHNMSVSWDVVPCSLAEVYQCFRGAYCLHHQCGCGSNITEDSRFHTRRRENLKSHRISGQFRPCSGG